ncbi:DUF2313 domain-containing protein [Clostridium sp. 'deep sea']|uniref:putative phage tail protein n=1 Tax=Clostridium sp. 'deep sea' TaxID=2779445 RepID=UPI001896A2BB|nr:putative phage tail protein [Clostridium sp. 'deep sea']QOR36646.1 DUF2313 domain-containing protein [Clostridium sp. 'deep sea']
MSKQTLINNLQKLFRQDEFINALFNSAGQALNSLNADITALEQEHWFDTMSIVGIAIYEKQLNFKTNNNSTIEDRRSQIEARWKMGGKSDLELLQNLADSWRNGAIEIKFKEDTIEVEFISTYGVPRDFQGIKNSLETSKPAHLAITYTFKYRTWGELKAKTWAEIKTKTWKDVREGEI